MEKLLNELRVQAKELLELGDSHDAAKGRGMFVVIWAVEKEMKNENRRKKETKRTGSG